MCGRFTLINTSNINKKFNLNILSNYNIYPSTKVLLYTHEPKFLNWGFSIQFKGKKFNVINIRIESLLNKKEVFQDYKRCIFFSDGWYEWSKTLNIKKVFYHHINGNLLYFAGIYSDIGCAIITETSINKIKHIHSRQPLALVKKDAIKWLNNGQIYHKSILNISFHQVSRYVNSLKNNNTKCTLKINTKQNR